MGGHQNGQQYNNQQVLGAQFGVNNTSGGTEVQATVNVGKLFDNVFSAVILIGALNWGYVAFTNDPMSDLVRPLLGDNARLVYGLVGVAGVILLIRGLQKNLGPLMTSQTAGNSSTQTPPKKVQ